MQFVANLLFSSEDSVDRLLENATSRLVSQGLFLLTITDANVLVRKMREKAVLTPDNTYKYENEHVSIMFDSLEFKGCPYGLKYSFYLEDSVGERNPETK
jgi:mRNA (guanine-N7-)-methyltransferase